MTTSSATATTTNPKAYGASSTSFYTDEEKKDSYESLEDVLGTKCGDPMVRHVIKDKTVTYSSLPFILVDCMDRTKTSLGNPLYSVPVCIQVD